MSDRELDQIDETVLHAMLARTIPDIHGRPVGVAQVQLRRSDLASWYGAYVVTVALDSGEQLRLFLKDLGSCFGHRARHGYEEASSETNRSDLMQRREREMQVYRHLIGRSDAGTPTYYGSVSNADEDRFWLLLEFVDGMALRYCDVPYWIAAAGWLGRMQRRFADQEDALKAASYLVRHDEAYYRTRAVFALRDATQIAPSSAGLLERVLDRYNDVVNLMVHQPYTLVHGNYLAPNILIAAGREPMRVCPVDWEESAYGATLYDLAFLCDGFDAPVVNQMCSLYRQEAAADSIWVVDQREMTRIIDCFRLFRVIKFLSRGVEKRFSEAAMVKLIDRAEMLSDLVA